MLRALAAAGRALRAVAAVVVLAGLLGGVPWLLAASAGWPLGWIGWTQPGNVPGLSDLYAAATSPWSDTMIYGLLASVGWVLWALFLRDLVIETVEASVAARDLRRGRPRTPTSRRGPIRWVAAALVGAIIGAMVFDTARAAIGAVSTAAFAADDLAAQRPAVAVASAHPVAEPTVKTQSVSGPRAAITATPASGSAATRTNRPRSADLPTWAADAPGGVHHVVSGDNLWDIADHTLGDPHRWREIYVLNRGHEQANGYALHDPDEIHVGWILALPARHKAEATSPPAPKKASPPQTAPEQRTEPGSPTESHPNAPASTPPPSTIPPTTPNTSPTPARSSGPVSEQAAPQHDPRSGITLPSQGWISLGLAATIAAIAALLRLHQRRHARLTLPISTATGPTPPPVPAEFAAAEAAGRRDLDPGPAPSDDDKPLPATTPTVPAPIGVDTAGKEISLFSQPGRAVALDGEGADPVVRAMLASALATGVRDQAAARPVAVTNTGLLARLLPADVEAVGLDPNATTFDGERLIVLADTGEAVTHAEEETIGRRRLLDAYDAESISELNTRADHAETQPPYLLILDAIERHTGRIAAIAANAAALHLYVIVVGRLDGVPALTITADGTAATEDDKLDGGRLATLTATDLAHLLAMIADTAARPEPGDDIDTPAPPAATANPDRSAPNLALDPPPTSTTETPAPVRLAVLGPVTVTTDNGPITTGMRSGSYAVLALLAAHPHGRTLDQIAADIHPDTDPTTAIKRIRTDITTARRVLRAANGNPEPMFIVHDPATSRYHLDPNTIEVDLWRMLTAINHANNAADDPAALTALREAADLYGGDFADGQDQAWVTDYATTHRHQILSVYARIAEILEADQPDAAVAALEQASRYDPINEELYQRIMRIHGRQHRPDAVRRTLRRLEDQLAELGGAEPSEATRRVAGRLLRPAASGVGA